MGRSSLRRVLARLFPEDVRSGVALLAAAALALALANSRWGPFVAAFWRGDGVLNRALVGSWFGAWPTPHWVVADVLMPVFFFSVGLELRAELAHGALSEWRRAALPLAAAVGGMLLPAAIYLATVRAPELRAGWGVPIATDIAFALGVLALLGSSFVHRLQLRGVRMWVAYVPGALLAWLGCYAGGLHPTLAGVALGLLVRAAPNRANDPPLAARLKPWVELFIMPVFALANAGVVLGGVRADGPLLTVSLSVGLALLLGKPLGVLSMSWLWVKLGLARLPAGVGARELIVLGSAAGISFTMALFVAQLAFAGPALLDAARLGVVGGSAAAALATLALGRALLPQTCAVDQSAVTAEK